MVLSKLKTKKKNFSDCEIQVLLAEVERRRKILFNGVSMGVSNRRKRMEWHRVCVAVNNVSSDHRSPGEVKKKWFDIKVQVKKRISAHRQGVSATGWSSPLSPLDERVALIMEDIQPIGALAPPDGYPDMAESPTVKAELEDQKMGVLSGVELPEFREELAEYREEAQEGGGLDPGRGESGAGPSSVSGATHGCGLIDSPFQTQRDLIRSIDNMTSELKHIGSVLCEISSTLKELVKTYTVVV